MTLVESNQYELKKPQIKGIQLTGYFGAEGYKEVDVSNIESIGIKKIDVGKTLLIGTASFVGTMLLMSAFSSESCNT